jgi:DNA repair exonuclease SbcCD ATPase subunit
LIFFKRITLDAFRGFTQRQEIPLDADAIVVTGSNGLGKTSLIDAIAWTLTGDLVQMAKKQDKRTEEYVVSQYRKGDVARVELDLMIDAVAVRVTREGSSRDGSSLSVAWPDHELVGSAAEDALATLCRAHSPGELKQAVDGWGVLRQDELRAVLSAPAEDFQARLRDILGLGVLAEFEQHVKAAHRRAAQATGDARKELAQARDADAAAETTLVSARDRIERVPDGLAGTGLAERLQSVGATIRLVTEVPTSLDDLRGLLDDANISAAVLREASRELRSLRSQLTAHPLPSDAEALGGLEHRVRESEGALVDARAARASVSGRLAQLRSEADAIAQLAAAALPLVGATCPVCGQATDPADVQQRLAMIVDAAGAGQSLLDAEAEVTTKTAQVANLESALDEARSAAAALTVQIAQHSRLVEELRVWRSRLNSSLDSSAFEFPLVYGDDDPSPEAFESTIGGLDVVQIELTRAVRHGQQRSSVERVPALERNAQEAQARTALLLGQVEALARREAEAKTLADAAAQAGVDVTGETLQAIDPYFGEVFGRLAAHPTFSRLGLEHEVYYGKARTWARITDPVAGLEVNPRIVCSEGQLNVVALSFFVAFALTGGSRSLPFVVLDDPLQSLDEMNVLGFSDLCRHLRDGRQLIVTTHDRRFGNLLLRKLTPRNIDQVALRVHFDAWDRSGPAITVSEIAPQVVPEILLVDG